MRVGYNVSPPFFLDLYHQGITLKRNMPPPQKTCSAAIYQTLTRLYLCCCVLVGLVVLANSRPSWQIEPRFLKAPCAIHYGHVLNGNSSKPSTDLHAHLLSWSMSCSCCASRDCGRISTAFFGARGVYGEAKDAALNVGRFTIYVEQVFKLDKQTREMKMMKINFYWKFSL